MGDLSKGNPSKLNGRVLLINASDSPLPIINLTKRMIREIEMITIVGASRCLNVEVWELT